MHTCCVSNTAPRCLDLIQTNPIEINRVRQGQGESISTIWGWKKSFKHVLSTERYGWGSTPMGRALGACTSSLCVSRAPLTAPNSMQNKYHTYNNEYKISYFLQFRSPPLGFSSPPMYSQPYSALIELKRAELEREVTDFSSRVTQR